MGIYADILSSAYSIDVDAPRDGSHRHIVRQLRALLAKGDVDYPSGYAAANEVQSIAVYQSTVSGGTFTLAFTMFDGTTFTTGNIAYNANAATIQTAVDTAAAAAIDGYTAGDIAITGGPLTTTPVVATFSGDSVEQANHGLITVDGALLTGGGSAGAVSQTTAGQPNRTAWAILKITGAINGSLPAHGATPSGLTGPTDRNSPALPDSETLRALARECAAQDQNTATEAAILEALGLN